MADSRRPCLAELAAALPDFSSSLINGLEASGLSQQSAGRFCPACQLSWQPCWTVEPYERMQALGSRTSALPATLTSVCECRSACCSFPQQNSTTTPLAMRAATLFAALLVACAVLGR